MAQNISSQTNVSASVLSMARHAWLLVVVFTMGCAATVEEEREESIVARNDPIGDYIAVSELTKVSNLKPVGTLRHELLTWNHVILRDRRKTYLVDFGRKCGALGEEEMSSEIVPNPGRFRVPVDTYRGCSFQSVYALTKAQEKELSEISDRFRK